MKKNEIIKKELSNTNDLLERKIKYRFHYVYLLYLETVSSSDRVNSFILNNITNPNHKIKLKNLLAAPNIKKINIKESIYYLYSGFTIIIYKNKIYALETKAELDRSITTPQIEPSIYGPKDSLVENYQKNIGLIKKRLKSKHLKILNYKLGRFTQTTTGLLYLDNVVKKDLVDYFDSIIKKIDTDSIIDSSELKSYLIDEKTNFFPSAKLTERPDTIIYALLQGKIVIMCDNSSFAIIVPAVLADFINPTEDNYSKSNNINFLKVLRLICFIITIITPAFYIAIANYNQETIPATLLTSFISQIKGVPFPTVIEAFFMLFVCEMLRESDIRFPNGYGTSISVLGALILGDAAVSASIVSPIMIIIIALTFISSMIFNEIELTSAVRAWRFIFLIIASFYGLYGVALSLILLIVNISSYKSFDLSYTFPVSPFNIPYLKHTLFKSKRSNNKFRSKFLTNNIRKRSYEKDNTPN